MTMFQVDLDKLRNYLWYCYEKQWWWGCRGCKQIPKSFDLLEIWATSLKIRVKMTPNIAWLQKIAPKFCRKTHEDLFGGHTKKGLNYLCGREFVGKSCTKLFGEFGEIRAKILRIPKTLPAPKPMMKRPLRSCNSPCESTEGWMFPPCLHLLASLCIFYTRVWEPMAREPDVALLMMASDSLDSFLTQMLRIKIFP